VTDDPGIPRRRFLIGLGGAGIAVSLAACAPSNPSATPTIPPATATPTPVASPSSSPVLASPSPPPDPAILRRKIARMFIVGFRGSVIGPDHPIIPALQAGLGGVILFNHAGKKGESRNIESRTQVRDLTDALRTAAPGPLLIAVDQEGGEISRLDPAQGFPATRSQAAIGATDDPSAAEASGRAMGTTMAAAGIDLDLAPVVDLDINPKNPAVGALERSFSVDPTIVAAMAEAEIRGLHSQGIKAVIKHFPGLGSASANTDFATVDVTATWTEAELGPYETLIGLGLPDAIMTGHIIDRKLDPTLPASLSPAIVGGMLRDQLGWDGPVMTDSLGATAISDHYTRSEAVALAIEAGNDLLTFASQPTRVDRLVEKLVAIVEAHVRSGRISEARIDESLARLDRLLAGPRG
jgi:beta-N-acetylhexosaminidase